MHAAADLVAYVADASNIDDAAAFVTGGHPPRASSTEHDTGTVDWLMTGAGIASRTSFALRGMQRAIQKPTGCGSGVPNPDLNSSHEAAQQWEA